MAQNTQLVRRGNLTIKFSPKYPIGEFEIAKLLQSLKLAEQVVARTFNLLQFITMRRGAPSQQPSKYISSHRPGFDQALQKIADNKYFENLDPVNMLSIHHHFGLGVDDGCAGEWSRSVGQIASFYRAILSGIHHLPSIADAHSTVVAKEVDRTMAKWRKAGSQGDVLDVMQRGHDEGFTLAAKTRGIVLPKKAFMAQLSDEQVEKRNSMKLTEAGDFIPALEITEKDYGSIHINFQELLRPEKNVSDLSVARTIIHEASHKFCNTQDYSYADPVQVYNVTPSSQKLWNADSYAFCAVCLFTGQYIETNSDMPA